jgi:hypothetical protein
MVLVIEPGTTCIVSASSLVFAMPFRFWSL